MLRFFIQLLQKFVTFSAIFFCLLVVSADKIFATDVSANITSDTTWNSAGSPYNLTTSISLTGAGTDLIIDASAGPVVVTFCNNCYLQITSGTTLDVNGTAGNSVTFKHVSSTAAGAWDSVYVNSGATLTVDYAIFNHAQSGLKCRGGSCSVSQSTFDTNTNGISVYDGSTLTTIGNTFNKNTTFPIDFDFQYNTVLNLGTGANADVLGTGANLNGYNAIGIGGVDINATGAGTSTLTQRTFAGITNIPYVVSNTTINLRNAKFIFDAGVVVKFSGTSSHFSVWESGYVDINGTLAEPVIFTSVKDDNYGGDTNNNGSANSPAVGDWNSIGLHAGGVNTVDYLVLKYSTSGIFSNQINTSLNINDSVFESNNYALGAVTSSTLTTARNTFKKTTYAPLTIDFENPSLTLGTGANADILGTGADLNGFNAIGVGGIDNTSDGCSGGPCTISQRTFAGISNIPYVITNNTMTLRTQQFIFDPGVIIKFSGTSSLFSVHTGGRLDVNGTLTDPVIFTSVKDDTYGGDTNNNGSANSPAKNDWNTIGLYTSGVNTIDFAKIMYAATGIAAGNPNITINDSEISNNIYGIQFSNATSPVMSRVNIENNGSLASGEYRYGALNTIATTINANNLFWGATNGPNDADAAGSCGLNTTATGNAVRDTAANPIDYCPFSAVRFNSLLSLLQFEVDGSTAIATGGTNDTDTTVVKMSVDSFTTTGTLTLEVETKLIADSFTGTATHSNSVSFTGTRVQGAVTLDSLVDGDYHWQSRVCDASSLCSEWVSYGENAENSIDFTVDAITNLAPNTPTSLGPTQYIDGSYGSDNTPTLTFSLSDPDEANTVSYQIQIDDSADFGSLIVNYTSAQSTQGAANFQLDRLLDQGLTLQGLRVKLYQILDFIGE